MSHPDVRRIFALLDDRLDDGQRRAFEEHLRQCTACESYRSRVARVGHMVKQTVQTAAVPEIDFDAMESRLLARLAASTPAPRTTWLRVLMPAAITACLVLAIALSMRGRPAVWLPSQPSSTGSSESALLDGAPGRARVTLLAGAVKLAAHRGEPKYSVTIGADLAEGSVIETSSTGRVVVQTALETGFQVTPDSSVELLSLRDTGSVLFLESGHVDNRVKRLRPDGVYRIVSGDLFIEVHGTRFEVTRRPGQVAVEVAEGVVTVRHRGEEEGVRLVAPARATFTDGSPVARATISRDPKDPRDLALYVQGTWVLPSVLRVPVLPGVRRIEVDGMNVGASDLLLAHARGTADVVIYPLEGAPIHMTLPVDRSSVTLHMPEAEPTPPPFRPVGRIDREAVSAAMAGYRNQVQRCYDRRLKRLPTLRDRIELSITIGTEGTVTSAQLRGAGHDPEVSDCILRVANRWTFQAPQGGPVTVSVPFSFSPRGHEDEDPAP
jgi:TonB family protein